MIVPVTGENLREAAEVYAHGWRASHEAFCTQEFLSQHTDLYLSLIHISEPTRP